MDTPYLIGERAFTWRRFLVSLATDDQEREAVLRLRHEVFCREWQGCSRADGLDQDRFDAQCDHLMISDRDSGLLIGTYRFNSKRNGGGFYTSDEFDLDGFGDQDCHLVEMGRACIRRKWRNNMVLLALGRGIAWYARTRQIDCYFGCSSVMTTDPQAVAVVAHWLERQGYILDGHRPRPRRGHRVIGFHRALSALGPWSEDHDRQAQELLPPLLRFYLAAGARVAVEPSLDPHFRCVDFFTALDFRHANHDFISRYR